MRVSVILDATTTRSSFSFSSLSAISGAERVWGFGFGYGICWVSFIMILLSVVLLICDRESEEIFYKEKQVEEDEEEEEEEA